MTPALRELFRENLIAQLAAAAPSALRVNLLAMNARAAGLAVTEAETAAELLYLSDKGLAARAEKSLSPEIHEWRITAAGRDYAAEHALA